MSLSKFALASDSTASWWPVQSIDTVKFSRDLAREKAGDRNYDTQIAAQVRDIASTGATHIALGTPYDEEFIPYLKRWVGFARQNNLKIWFRGNFSGWEGWFEYPKINRAEHLKKTAAFLKNHADIFKDGDILTMCPECENGSAGDPRYNGDVLGYKNFLLDLYKTCSEVFRIQGKTVYCNYFSMNGDVARLIMDKETTKQLGGIVVVDHYVKTPEKLSQDIKDLAVSSGGKIVLGEFGAPIPDIHGTLSPEAQAIWIDKLLGLLADNTSLVGLNYWTNIGSSTHAWNSEGKPRPVVDILSKYYKPLSTTISVSDEFGKKISSASVTYLSKQFFADKSGQITLNYFDPKTRVTVEAPGYGFQVYSPATVPFYDNVVLEPIHEDFWYKTRKFFLKLKQLFR